MKFPHHKLNRNPFSFSLDNNMKDVYVFVLQYFALIMRLNTDWSGGGEGGRRRRRRRNEILNCILEISFGVSIRCFKFPRFDLNRSFILE